MALLTYPGAPWRDGETSDQAPEPKLRIIAYTAGTHGPTAESWKLGVRVVQVSVMEIGMVTAYFYPTLGGIQEHVPFLAIVRGMRHDVRILVPHVGDELASVPHGRQAHALDDDDDGVIRVGVSVSLLSGNSSASPAP